MKKNILFAGLTIAACMAMTMPFAAEEEAISEAAVAEVVETSEDAQPVMSPSCGSWVQMGSTGEYINIYDLMVFPDNTAVVDDQILTFEAWEDGTLKADLTGVEGAEGFEITAEVSTVTEQSLAEYEVTRGERSYIDDADGADQLILTVNMPDASNPLAAGTKTAKVFFLKYFGQDDFLEKWMSGKTWKIGENTLAIDAEGNLNLNNGASTGSTYFSYNEDKGIRMSVQFSWDNGGYFTYVPTQITADTIVLENVDNPSEVQTLVLDSVMEAPVEEAMTE